MDLIESVRLEIGDSVNGILPGNRQVATKTFLYAAGAEGVADISNPTKQEIGRVSAKVLEMAAIEWSIIPVESELGPAAEVRKTGDDLRKEAARLRAIYGYGTDQSTASRTSTRIPSYSSNAGYNIPPGVSE